MKNLIVQRCRRWALPDGFADTSALSIAQTEKDIYVYGGGFDRMHHLSSNLDQKLKVRPSEGSLLDVDIGSSNGPETGYGHSLPPPGLPDACL